MTWETPDPCEPQPVPRDAEHAALRSRVVGVDVIEQCSDQVIREELWNSREPDRSVAAVLRLRGMLERRAREP